jgi:cell division transport system permease protein
MKMLKFYCTEAWKNISRYERSGISAVLIVAVLISVMGMFTWVAYNVSYAQKILSQEMGILVFMKEGTRDDVPSIMEKIKQLPEVGDVRLITKEQALEEIGSKPDIRQEISLLGFNPLPDTIEVKTASAFTPGQLKTIAESIQELPGVDLVDYGQDTLNNITRTLEIVKYYIWLVGIVLTFITLVLAAIATQMLFTDRVRDMEILQSVGATSAFIRVPILIESVIYGALGSVVALTFLYAVYNVTKLRIEPIVFVPNGGMYMLFAGGVVICFLGTLVESFRHIKLK